MARGELSGGRQPARTVSARSRLSGRESEGSASPALLQETHHEAEGHRDRRDERQDHLAEPDLLARLRQGLGPPPTVGPR
jgi:hypothetical protein